MPRRLFLFAVVVALLVAGAVWLAERPGVVTIHWQGWRVDTSVPVLVAALVVGLGLVWGGARLVVGVVALPRRLLAARREKRRRQGYVALSDGLAAVAAGDRAQAGRLARRADKLLADPALTGVLTAQAAELGGDDIRVERGLTAMLDRPETALLGLKGLMERARKTGDEVAALAYGRRAWSLGVASVDLATALFELQARAGLWDEAQVTLREAERRKVMRGAVLLHRRAVVGLERSAAAEAAGEAAIALELALKAHHDDIGLVAATVRAAGLLHRAGRVRKAQSVIVSTWKVAPHPSLVEALTALAPQETVLDRVRRLERLVRANPDAADGHVALAEAALAAKLWGQARTHLNIAMDQRPNGGVLVLLARLEREEGGDDQAARGWLAQLPAAPAEPAWVCGQCGRPADSWAALCPHCRAVDSLEWRDSAQTPSF